jgi:hypothetical protein
MSLVKLKEKDFSYLYQVLDIPVTDFDCGSVCAKKNKGVPVCCEVNVVVPVLYSNEFKYVKKRSTLWKHFVADTKHDKRLKDECSYDEVMCTCNGAHSCERKFRSFVCRTFPLTPYITAKNDFIGLTYSYDFEKKCPIIGKPGLIKQSHVNSAIKAWSFVFDKDYFEFCAHFEVSRRFDRLRKRKKKLMHVFTKHGVKTLT